MILKLSSFDILRGLIVNQGQNPITSYKTAHSDSKASISIEK